MSVSKMTFVEKRSVISLSAIMSLRMIGLFLVLPIFTLYASQLPGATPFLVGLSLGIYGLSQAILQIPFGSVSDFLGRKPIIFAGLCIFIIGSLLAAFANSIGLLILARGLQGAGAVGSTLLALLSDLTRENQRTKAMAIAGISIGFSFSLAMLLGPLLTTVVSIRGLFFIATILAILAIILLIYVVPTAQIYNKRLEKRAFKQVLFAPQLMNLNLGIFILHAIFTASFVALPLSLKQDLNLSVQQQWLIYLPSLSIAFVFSLLFIGIAEKKQWLKSFFMASILSILIAQIFFILFPSQLFFSLAALSFFFIGFSMLEAFLPSLISRSVNSAHKGSALGIYSCAQFFGIFIGGSVGGFLYAEYSFAGVYYFCILLALIWFLLSFRLSFPPQMLAQELPIPKSINWATLAAQFESIPGIVEVVFIKEEGIAYLRMEHEANNHPSFKKLKQNLYALNSAP